MSREDSQFKLRMPASLREAVEAAARDNKRSLNAEIVARLEESHFRTGQVQEIPSAKRARELAATSRKRTAEEVRKEALLELQMTIGKGSSVARVDLRDMGLEEMSDTEHADVTQAFCDELAAAGYQTEWDGPDFLTISFDES